MRISVAVFIFAAAVLMLTACDGGGEGGAVDLSLPGAYLRLPKGPARTN